MRSATLSGVFSIDEWPKTNQVIHDFVWQVLFWYNELLDFTVRSDFFERDCISWW